MDEQELKESYEFYVNWKHGEVRDASEVIIHRERILKLCEAYLSARKEMPEKKEIGEIRYCGCNPDFDRGGNQAIDDCTLARLKKKAEYRNEYGECYICKKRMPLICKDCRKAEFDKKLEKIEDIIDSYATDDTGWGGTHDGVDRKHFKAVATAIRGYLGGGK